MIQVHTITSWGAYSTLACLRVGDGKSCSDVQYASNYECVLRFLSLGVPRVAGNDIVCFTAIFARFPSVTRGTEAFPLHPSPLLRRKKEEMI